MYENSCVDVPNSTCRSCHLEMRRFLLVGFCAGPGKDHAHEELIILLRFYASRRYFCQISYEHILFSESACKHDGFIPIVFFLTWIPPCEYLGRLDVKNVKTMFLLPKVDVIHTKVFNDHHVWQAQFAYSKCGKISAKQNIILALFLYYVNNFDFCMCKQCSQPIKPVFLLG